MTDDLSPLQRELIAESWRRGDLDYKRHEAQQLLHKVAEETDATISVLHAARGFGKTFDALLWLLEHGLRHRNQRTLFAAATREDAKKIVSAVMPMVSEDAPEEFKPVWVATDHLFRLPSTNSVLIVEGADDDRGNHLRGPHIHRCVADEAGFWRHMLYVIKSVLLPQVQRVGGKMRVQSTSPESVGHDFVGLCNEAMANDAYKRFTIHDNPRLTPAQIQRDAEEVSGLKGADVWRATMVRREFLCEFVTETERAVIPEFNNAHIVSDFTMPTFVDTYSFLDLGLIDLTHNLFAYWDFARAKLVIVDELAGQYMRTKDFAARSKAKEAELWGHLPYFGAEQPSHNRAPWGRYSDNEAQQLYDLAGYGLPFAPALKTDKEAAINGVRVAFVEGKIEIHERCKQLIHQLRVGVWNERRTDYERIPGAGHLDGLDALVYGWRMMNRDRNPVPPLLGVASSTHHIPATVRKRYASHPLMKPLRR